MTTPPTGAQAAPGTERILPPPAPLSIDPIAVDALAPGQWLAMHIYYTSNPQPLLRELRARRLVTRFFFIRYWLEGPHTRVRFQPAELDAVPEICRLAEAAVDAYLARRPAVYEVDLDLSASMYKQMFLSEYSEAQWRERYGDSEVMPIQPNNSYIYTEYLPEYDRYGGPAGIELAEWHFECSSDMVIRLMETTNVHVRSVLFGLGLQLMAVMCFTFLRDPAYTAEFLLGYGSYWENSYAQPGGSRHDLYDEAYEDMANLVRRRVAEIHRAVVAGDHSGLSGFVRDWAGHCAELRARVVALTGSGKLLFQEWQDADQRVPASDLDLVMRVLLASYVHMTDNRIGITIHDEIYLSYVLRRAILDALVPAAAA
jgi:thiopeptide-type bacteriocin biosynthesis protein